MPDIGLSDGYQTLNLPQFAETMEFCRRVAEVLGKVVATADETVRCGPNA